MKHDVFFENDAFYIVEGQGFFFLGQFIDPYSEDESWDGEYLRFNSIGKHSTAFLELSVSELRGSLYSVRRYFGASVA